MSVFQWDVTYYWATLQSCKHYLQILAIFTNTDCDLRQFPVSVGQMRGVRMTGLKPESKSLWEEESLRLYQHWETICGFLNQLMWYSDHLKMYNSSLISLAYLASCSLFLWCHAKKATWAKRCSHWQQGKKIETDDNFLGFYYKPKQICSLLLLLRDVKAQTSSVLLAAQQLSPHVQVSPLRAAQSSRAVPTYLAGVHIWPIGLVVSLRPGWLPGCAVGGSADTAETFSSSLLLRQAALGFRFRSVTEESEFLISHPLTPWAISIQEPWSKNSSAASPFSCPHPLLTHRCPKLQTITTESPARQLLNWYLKNPKRLKAKPKPFQQPTYAFRNF